MSDSTREIAADLLRSAEELSQGQAKVGLKRIFLGPNALDRLRSEVDSVAGGGPVVILEDRTPMRRSDDDLKQLVEQLLDGRSGVKRVSLGMDHEQLHADESTLAEARALVVGASCVVTVGSGTITDIGKDACHSNGGTPLVVIQTAPSVNGYSDDMAVILKDGAKRTTPSIWPTTLLIDTKILQDAPQSLIASGYAEMMAMFTAPADWKLAQLVGLDESYREAIVDMFRPMGPQLLASAPGIAARESDAIELLATLLTYTGVAMGIAGRTAPLSGTEHLISHLIDMSAPAEGLPTGLHGAQVGVGAVIAAVIWKRAVKQVTPDMLIQRSVDRTRAEAAVGDAFGRLDDTGAMADECWTDYQSKLTRWESASIRDDNANQLVDRMTDLASEIVEPGAIIDALSTAGAPTRFSELDPPVSRDRARWVVGSAPLMRDRFTIIDLAALTGGWTATDVEEVLDEAAELGGWLVNLVDRYDGFVFDLDGTVYLGDALLPGAADTIAAIRGAGKPIVYLTNKPLDPSVEYADKLTRLGVKTSVEDVVSSLDSLISYMTSVHAGSKVICVTEELVIQTLRGVGFDVLPLDAAEEAAVVVVSFDRTFDYAKLHAAFRAVRAGAVIVATNPDPYCPTPEGGLPDCAAMLAAIEVSTGTTAEVVLGKPSPRMIQAVLERINLPREGLLMVGDRAGTDVVMAHAADIDSALVLSGATTRAEAVAFEPAPKYLFDDLSGLLDQQPEPEYVKGN